MSKIIVRGGNRLSGEMAVHGAKNSALPILAATVLCRGESTIHNCPRLSDINAAIKILEHLGCSVKRQNDTITVNSENIKNNYIPDNLMREMRSSIIFLGSIVSRTGAALLSSPGGCELGPRPIDIHISALRSLGVDIDEDHGNLNCKVKKSLKGAEIIFPLPSVGATENAMIAASVSKGRTIIRNAAREPEIADLADFLRAAGAKIKGDESGNIEITGVQRLHAAEHTVISDRIAAATYMSAAAVTGGDIYLKNIMPKYLLPVLDSFREAGCEITADDRDLHLKAPERLKSVSTIKTHFYPGFPTDAAPTTLAMLTVADGTSIFVENIFENRFKYIDELKRLGAKVSVEGKVAVVRGVESLWGASVECTDLRGGAALVVAALAAKSVTYINKIHHIERGYENMEGNLAKLGANIIRE